LFRAVPASALDRIEEVARMMTDANVAIYPVDVRGLGEAEPTELGIMTTLADMTGGRASYNTNGLANAMRQAVRDAEVTYTLGFYVSEDETDTGFHELSVEVDRPEVDVRHRGGYYGFGGEAQALDLPGLDETLVSTFDATSLGLLASASPSEAAPGTFDLAIIADVNDMGLSQVEERWVGSLTGRLFFYGTEDQDGRVLPVETYPIVLTEELLLTARATGFVITRNVDTDGQPGFLRLVLQDGTNGATGSLWVPLDYD
jgi:hypothetical protein